MSRSAYLSFAVLVVAVAGCQSSPVSSSGYAVTSCSSSGDCPDGSSCERDHCLETCAADADCPTGAVCARGECWAGRFGACETDADCRSGEACVAASCVELPDFIGCTADSECPAGTACDPATGTCETRSSCTPTTETCGNGIDDDCNGLVDDGCTPTTCAADADCATGEVCLRGTCYASDPSACTTDSDCAVGEACVSGACTPRTVCPDHETCGNGIDDDCNGIVDDGCGTDPTACRADSDCAAGQVCTAGTCTPAR